MTSNRHHNIYIDGAACFWTSSVIDKLPVFRSRTACIKVLNTLDKCRKVTNVKLLGYVMMPEHVHLVAWSEKSNDVQIFIRQFLRDSSADITDLAAKAAQRSDPTAAVWLDRFRNRARQGAKARIWKERGRAFPVTLGDGLY